MSKETQHQKLTTIDLSDQTINSLPGIFFLSDQKSGMIVWNNNLETISGYTEEELGKIKPLQLFDSRNQEKVKQSLKKSYLEGYGSIKATVKSKIGKRASFFFTWIRIEYKGKPAIIGAGTDITKRKKKEKELSEDKRFYESIISNLPGYFYRVKNDMSYTPEYISEGVTQITGYSVDEYLVTRTISCGEEVLEEYKQQVWDQVQKAIGKRIPYEVTYQLLTKTRKTKWVWERGNGVWNSKNELLALEGFVTDITKLKKAEEKLELQFGELQKTNYELDHFVYSVSHDLRAPLASILGLINICELGKPDQEQQQNLGMIKESVLRLDGFIHDILDYSRNTRLSISIEKIDFQELFEEVQSNLKQVNEMERLNIELEIYNEIPHYSDRSRLRMVFSNLLSNAIKYLSIARDSSILVIHVKTTPEKATILFMDNGIGIDKQYLSKVFDMFFRASVRSKGSGLGLYIARETILKLGGSIIVDSELDKFTSFEITIPNLQHT
jgi:PAS domain S-box-containing protein